MMRPDGTYECDRCGADVGNGGVDKAASITDTEPGDLTRVRQLKLCLDRPGDDGKKIQGCRDRVLTKKALRHHHETRTATT